MTREEFMEEMAQRMTDAMDLDDMTQAIYEIHYNWANKEATEEELRNNAELLLIEWWDE